MRTIIARKLRTAVASAVLVVVAGLAIPASAHSHAYKHAKRRSDVSAEYSGTGASVVVLAATYGGNPAIGGGGSSTVTSSGSGGWRDYVAQKCRSSAGIADPRTEKVEPWGFENGSNSGVTPGASGTGTAFGGDAFDATAVYKLTGPSVGSTGYALVNNVNSKKTIGALGSQRWCFGGQFRLITTDANATFIIGPYQGTDGFAAVGFFGTQFGALTGHVAGGLPNTTTPTTTATLPYNAGSLYSVMIWSDGTTLKFEGYDGTTDTGDVTIGPAATAFPHTSAGGNWYAIVQGVTAVAATQPSAYVYNVMIDAAVTP